MISMVSLDFSLYNLVNGLCVCNPNVPPAHYLVVPYWLGMNKMAY